MSTPRWTSRKLWTTIACSGLLWAMHERALMLLYSYWLPEQISAFTTLTIATMSSISVLVLGYMGFQSRISVQAAVSSALSAVSSRTGTDDLIKDMAAKYAGDDSYAPVKPDAEQTFR